MAARRVLIAVLAFIGGISIVAALFPVPPPGDQGGSTSTTSTSAEGPQRATPRIEPGGELIRASVRPSDEREPEQIEAELGDQLELLVYTRTGTQVEIAKAGVQEFADSLAPARFSLRLDQPGMYFVRPAEGGDPLATIVVSDPDRPGDGAGGGGGRGSGGPSPQGEPVGAELEMS